jgi:hypothetical protein
MSCVRHLKTFCRKQKNEGKAGTEQAQHAINMHKIKKKERQPVFKEC